jgi:hypothetical protein
VAVEQTGEIPREPDVAERLGQVLGDFRPIECVQVDVGERL